MGSSVSDSEVSSRHVERIPLGNCGEIVLRKIKKFIGRQVVEDAWIAEYSVGRTTCEFCLIKINRNNHDEDAPGLLKYTDLEMNIRVEQDFLVSKFHMDGPRSMVKLPECKSNNPLVEGGVLESTSFFYGRDTDERKGLIIILKDHEVWPYMITVKHYLFVSAARLSVQLEKPVEQHKNNLLTMFNDVKRTGWRPNYSADFEVEHSNSLVSSNQNQGTDNNNPETYGYNSMSGQQNVSSVVSTSGCTNGNYNGSLILENCQVWFDKARKMSRSY